VATPFFSKIPEIPLLMLNTKKIIPPLSADMNPSRFSFSTYETTVGRVIALH
jgi:hypothetical protein